MMADIPQGIFYFCFSYIQSNILHLGVPLKQRFQKRILPGACALIFFCLCLASCDAPSNIFSSSSIRQEQRSFDVYTDKIFVREMQKNAINLHYTLANPEKMGVTSHKVSLGSLSKESAKSAVAEIENISASLSEFDYGALDSRQQLSYDILKDYCDKELAAADFYYYEEPLRPTTGVQSELPVLLAEYDFSDSCDVTDYLALLTCFEDYVQQICVFEQEKAAKGLFMPDYAADAVIESCKAFAENPSENYLISTFNARIKKVSGLSKKKRQFYKKQNKSLIKNAVIPAYEKLAATLAELKDSSKNSAGLCLLPNGRAYYEHLVRSNTGSQKSVKELQKMTERRRNLDMAALQKILAANPSLTQSGDPKLAATEPKEILEHLLTAIQKDFYPAANTSYEINYVHKSLEDTLAPAFYLTAPIDDISRNVIYLNRRSQYSGIQLFTTLAHEGYPGHLYQTTGSYQAGLAPIRSLLNYPGYVEGWATYVEMLSYRYAGLEEHLADMLMHNQSALLSLYASIDMAIHYDGWQLADVTAFLNGYGIMDSEVIRSIYELIVEEPAHYLKYYIGYLEFLELKEYAKEEFGEAYSDRDFHQAIIRIGPSPFSILKNYLKAFYTAS